MGNIRGTYGERIEYIWKRVGNPWVTHRKPGVRWKLKSKQNRKRMKKMNIERIKNKESRGEHGRKGKAEGGEVKHKKGN